MQSYMVVSEHKWRGKLRRHTLYNVAFISNLESDQKGSHKCYQNSRVRTHRDPQTVQP